jgi:putative DNA primase/helicase
MHQANVVFRKDAALEYTGAGWAVVPLHTVKDHQCSCRDGSSCSRPGKHPRTSHGVHDATVSGSMVERWWKNWPYANIGIATGRTSGILIIDVDPRNGGSETLQKLQEDLGSLPATVTVQTGGGGRHLYFSYPSFEVRKDTAGKLLGPGVDVMSDGGFVVAPPSRHASGKRYRWQEGQAFHDLDPAALPEPWLSRLRGDDIPAQHPVDAHPPNGKVTEGTRNTVLTSAAGRFRNAGMDESQICAALVALNSQKCAPPLDLGEVAKISNSVARYAVKPFSANADLAEQVMPQVLDQHFAGGKHLLFGSDGQFWTYDGRKWHPVADAWLRGRVFETLEAVPDRTGKATSTVICQVQSLLEAKLAVADDPLRFLRSPLPVINCANGELWIGDDGGVELRPHSYASYLRHCLEVAYEPAARCSRYDAALRGIFAKALDPKSMVRHWNELTGYIISSRRNIPLIVVLQGGGGNGKTRLMQTVSRLLGRDQVCAIRIETLGTNRFIAAPPRRNLWAIRREFGPSAGV